jgi:hypothetical protein
MIDALQGLIWNKGRIGADAEFITSDKTGMQYLEKTSPSCALFSRRSVSLYQLFGGV